jgi:lipoate synthase
MFDYEQVCSFGYRTYLSNEKEKIIQELRNIGCHSVVKTTYIVNRHIHLKIKNYIYEVNFHSTMI